MLDPAELYRVEPDAPQLSEPVLVLALDGFVDAGAAARLAVDSLVATGPGQPVVRFDVDQLVDYRSRRPPLRFETDRWTSYSAPELEVVALTDSGGTGYLLLSGPEPDTQWERFAAAVEQLVRRLDVRLVVTMAGIPMAVPHTRPIGVTVHGTRSELTEGHESLFAAADVPGSAVALTEYRLGQAGHAAMGFAVHVPHYLARAEYPQAARVLVDHLAVATGLYLSTEALTMAAERTEREIAEQVAGSEEVAQVVAALERQYDTVVSGGGERSGAGLGGTLPSADELAAEVERFLAGHDDQDAPDPQSDDPRGDEPGSPPPPGPSE
jgi:proteasome assembly chaperone (PAC2) family protein